MKSTASFFDVRYYNCAQKHYAKEKHNVDDCWLYHLFCKAHMVILSSCCIFKRSVSLQMNHWLWFSLMLTQHNFSPDLGQLSNFEYTIQEMLCCIAGTLHISSRLNIWTCLQVQILISYRDGFLYHLSSVLTMN